MSTVTTAPQVLNDEMLARFEERAPAYDRENQFFTEDFEDKSKGQNIAEGFIQQGADVIMPVAGPAGLGGLLPSAELPQNMIAHLVRRERIELLHANQRHVVLLALAAFGWQVEVGVLLVAYGSEARARPVLFGLRDECDAAGLDVLVVEKNGWVGGAATSRDAALSLGCRWVGCDIDPAYAAG